MGSVEFFEYLIDRLQELRDGFVRAVPFSGAHDDRADIPLGDLAGQPVWMLPKEFPPDKIPAEFSQRIFHHGGDVPNQVHHIQSIASTSRMILPKQRLPRARYFCASSFFYVRGKWRRESWGRGYPSFGFTPTGQIFDAGWSEASHEWFDPRLDMTLRMMLGTVCTVSRRWTIEIGAGGRSLLLLTTPEGLRAAMAMRDVPEGKVRREALLHWVKSHWRHDTEGERTVHVREHKRGKRKFRVIGPIWCSVEDMDVTN